MNIPCAHSTGIERNHLFLDAGNIPLIFRNQLWFKLTIAVTGNIDLKFPVLAFECFARMTIPFIIAFKITLTIFFIACKQPLSADSRAAFPGQSGPY